MNPNVTLIKLQHYEINRTWNRPRVRRLQKLMDAITVEELAAHLNMDARDFRFQLNGNKLRGETKLLLHYLETSVLNKKIHQV